MESTRSWNRTALFFVFALSGFSGLIYESIWSHYLKLFLGHSAYSQTLVLAIFMGGMAIGAWWASRHCRKIDYLFWYYILAELIIGLFAFIFHPLYTSMVSLSYSTILPALGVPWLILLYKWSISALIILPQCILLGTTFPLMSNALIRRFPNIPGFDISMLYFSNSFGAAIGVLVSGFLLIKWVGLPGTIITGGVINIIVAVLTWVLTYLVQYETDTVRTSLRKQGESERPKSVYRFILFAAGITGAASFLYEIGWIRMLSMVLGASTHAFELMLSAFILGIALGGLWVRRRIDSLKNPIYFLGVVQLVMGILALGTILSYGHTFSLMAFFLDALARTASGYSLFNLSSHFIAMIVMMPVTFCAGMTLPLMTSMLIKRGYGEQSVGGVYAANTLGSIIGVVLAVQVVMPMFTVKTVVAFGAALDILLAIALFLWAKGRTGLPTLQSAEVKGKGAMVASVSSVVCAIVLVWVMFSYQLDPNKMAAGVYRGGNPTLRDGAKVIYKRDGKSATITVTKTKENVMIIATNGKPDASIDWSPKTITLDEPTQVLTAALPMSLIDSPTSAAVVGFGSGVTAHIVLDMPTIKRVDVVEIEPAMAEGARLFRPRNENVYTSSRSHIYYDDAKAFFSTYQRKYDMILSEPSNPWVSGVSGLFSAEFYKMVKAHLTEKGIFAQWLNTYETNMNLIVSVLKAINEVFPYYSIYSTDDTDILIVASPHEPVSMSHAKLFSVPKISEQLRGIGVTNVNDLNMRRVATEYVLRPYIALFRAPANSDFYPYLDLHGVEARYMKKQVVNFNNIGFLSPITMLEKDTPRFGVTRISQNFGYQRAKLIANAIMLYQGITRHPGYKAEAIPVDVNALVSVLAPDETRCVTTKNAKAWDAAFFKAGSVMTNYLSVQELTKAFGVIEKKGCLQTMPVLSRDWIELFEAVGQRNASGMARIAENMLEQYPDLRIEQQSYLLSVAMLGRLAHNQVDKAIQAWNRYNKRIFKGALPGGTMQVIFAYALSEYRNG